ncbi:Fc.00g039360.m01.CDS01 [Cosmosporella sp. VM-42]
MPVVDGIATLLPAPEGYVIDFNNPQRQGVPDAYYVAAFGTALSVILMGQRLYVKLVLSGGLQIDDVFLLLAWATAFTTEGLCIHMFASKAGGTHAWEISIDKFNMYMLDVYLAAFIYIVCGSLAKISLLIFYFRLSPQQWFRWSIWATIVFITGYTVGIFFPLIFACTPVAMSWDITIEGKCINRPSLYIATAVANIISDIILFALPIPMVIKLQIPRRQKFGLLGIFAIGSLTVVTSIVRVSILPELLTNPDASWVVSWASVWIIVESNLLVICAALPTLRKFFRHVAPKLIGESRYGSKTKTTEGSHPPSRTLVPSSQSRRDRHQYSKFDPEEGATHEAYAMGPVTGQQDMQIMGGSSEEAVGWGDSDSEKAIVAGGSKRTIVQTKTVTVQYSNDQQQ